MIGSRQIGDPIGSFMVVKTGGHCLRVVLPPASIASPQGVALEFAIRVNPWPFRSGSEVKSK
jgi:hypothetical protein